MSDKPSHSNPSEELARAEKALSEPGKPAKAAGHGKPSSAKGKGKKKKGEPEVPFKVRAAAAGKLLVAQFLEVIRGLRSPDRPTRRMSFFFLASIIGMLLVMIGTVKHYSRLRHEARQGLAEHEGATHETTHSGSHSGSGHEVHVALLDLGSFSVELKPAPGARPPTDTSNVADITFVVECDSKETHDFIEKNKIHARDEVTSALIGLEREEILTRDGKRKIKQRIMERLNGWMPTGKVLNVYVSKLIVG